MKNSPLYVLLWTAALGAQPGAAILQKLEVQSIEIAEVSTDRVRLRVRLDGVAQRNVSIRTLAFDDASINGVPVYSPAQSRPIHISKGTRFAVLDPLEASIFYRDLPSLEPLRQIVREEKARVQATVRLQPEYSLLQRIALWTSTAWVAWKVEHSVKVTIPGGSAAKTAAELTLAAADAMWVVGQRGLQWRRERDAFLTQVRRDYADRVLPVKTEYTVAAKDGSKSTILRQGLAFHLGAGLILTPAESVEPWMFDSAVAEMLALGKLRLIPGSLNVTVGPYSLAQRTLSIDFVGSDRSKGLSVERRKTFALRDRSSPANMARLKAAGLQGSRVNDAGKAGDVALFRRHEDGALELLTLSASEQNGRLHLSEPVDSRAYGSPVITPHGVLGILTSQSAIVPLPPR